MSTCAPCAAPNSTSYSTPSIQPVFPHRFQQPLPIGIPTDGAASFRSFRTPRFTPAQLCERISAVIRAQADIRVPTDLTLAVVTCQQTPAPSPPVKPNPVTSTAKEPQDTRRRAATDEDMRKWDRLYDENYSWLCSRAQYMGEDPETAKDMAQEVFLRALNASKPYDHSLSFRSYALRILSNIHCDRYRAEHARSTRFGGKVLSIEQIEDVPGMTPSYDPGLVASTEASDLWTFLTDPAFLPLSYHRTFVQIKMQGWTYKECAKHAGVPTGTVRSRLHRARKIMRIRYAMYEAQKQ